MLKKYLKNLCIIFCLITIIYDLQFGFRQKFSTSHALINLTENIRQALDNGYIGCGRFVDLQKAFDKVDHQILNLTTMVFEAYQITGLNPTSLIVNNLFLYMVMTLSLLK